MTSFTNLQHHKNLLYLDNVSKRTLLISGIVIILIGFVVMLLYKTNPASVSVPSPKIVISNVSEKIDDAQITGLVKKGEDIDFERPACEGEYYVVTEKDIVWLTEQGSSKSDREESFGGYLGQEVEVNGDYGNHGNNCDLPNQRVCTCHNYVLTESIRLK